MKDKVECPYCGEDIYVDTYCWEDKDEVFVDLPAILHEHQCEECGKCCMVRAFVSLSYGAEKLDCKNGLAEHRYEDVPISSRGHTIRRCKVCGEVEEEEEE